MRRPPGKRLLLVAAVVSLVGTALVAIAILLFGDFGETEARVLGTTAFISAYSLLSLPGGTLLEQGRLPWLAWTNVALAVLGFATAMAALWSPDDSETLWRLVGSTGATAVASTQAAGLASRRRASDPVAVNRLFVVSIALVLLIAALVVYAIWAEVNEEGYYRALGALAVANVLVLVLQPVLRRSRRAEAGFKLRVAFADGKEDELEIDAADFADAAARAIRRAERGGRRVVRVERGKSNAGSSHQ